MAPVVAKLSAMLALLQLSFATLPLPILEGDSRRQSVDFDWTLVEPSKELVYHDCFDEFKCARLLVPLDWQAPEESRYDNTIALAVVKLPAKVPITDPAYGGPVLTNPGGPGGSGVDFALGAGELLQWAVSNHSRRFDLVSFDPRGIGLSGPSTDCFVDPLQRDLWNIRGTDEGLVDTGEQVLLKKWSRSKALGKACANAGVGKYVSTPSVARDMLEIVERSEEERQKNIAELGSKSSGQSAEMQTPMTSSGKRHKSPSNAKLQYWGFSYGTILGATFASLFPDRVGRMILDGVADARDYSQQRWAKNLLDTDKILPKLYSYCFEAGPDCPLYNEAGPGAIEQDVNLFLEEVLENPIPAVDDSGVLPPTIITYSHIVGLLFQTLYSPIIAFPGLAAVIAQIQKGDYRIMLTILNAQSRVHCPIDSKTPVYQATIGSEAAQAVLCGDGDDMSNQTMTEFRAYLKYLQSESRLAGSLWSELRLACTGWKVRPAWRFTGPFEGNTSHPILWIGNTADPVTPLQGAINMSKSFPGSAVLQHDALGHCSVSAPSKCTIRYVREYFDTGKLPKSGTICPTDRKPFDPEVLSASEYYDESTGQVLKLPRWKTPLSSLNQD